MILWSLLQNLRISVIIVFDPPSRMAASRRHSPDWHNHDFHGTLPHQIPMQGPIMSSQTSKQHTTTHPNTDLVVGTDDKENWMRSENRRHGFHNLSDMCRSGWMVRAPQVLSLERSVDWRIANLDQVRTVTTLPWFSGMAVAQDQRLLFETYASDFGPHQRHSIQSISKTTVSLMIGKLVHEGRIDLNKPVSHYLPEIGSGYAPATVQDVLDMNVTNSFVEDYSDSYRETSDPDSVQGYNRLEIAMGWRLPPDGEQVFGIRDFVSTITSRDVTNPSRAMLYKSANTEVLAWIAETVSDRNLYQLFTDIVEAAGIEGAFYMSTDINGTPILSGGGALTARDLARYGLLIARGGVGVNGNTVASDDFINAARSGQGTTNEAPLDWIRYSNQLFTNDNWVGHLGFCGQFLLAHPESRTSIAFFSVLEEKDGDDGGCYEHIIRMAEVVLDHVQQT